MLTPEQRAAAGITSPPLTTTEERLDAILAHLLIIIDRMDNPPLIAESITEHVVLTEPTPKRPRRKPTE
jgi:hypothetical protein